MKLLKSIFFVLFVLLSVFSCKNERTYMNKYMVERDSIMQENKVKTQQLDELNNVIATIATELDRMLPAGRVRV